jgi:hypothetical protein
MTLLLKTRMHASSRSPSAGVPLAPVCRLSSPFLGIVLSFWGGSFTQFALARPPASRAERQLVVSLLVEVLA